MAQTIKLKRSATSGAVPATSALELGEMAINTHDGKVYIKKDDGTESVVEVGDKTPAELLTDIKTVDGSGSGLDADSVDGYHADRFFRRQGKANATVGGGWMTVATCTSGRRHGEVIVTDADSGDHAFIRIDWMRSYADSNFSVINCGGHQNRITGARVLNQTSDTTYGEKILQVYVTVSSNYEVNIYELGDIDDFTELTVVTPVIENTKTGYAVQGNELTGLDLVSLAAEEGIKAGGVVYAGGGLDVTGNASFADNGKATFGAGDDLQIYHDGSHSRIADRGTGDLRLYGDSLQLNSWTSAENYLTATTDGAVTIYHNGSPKLATTSTGIDVTGKVSSDGLEVDLSSSGNVELTGAANSNAGLVVRDPTATAYGAHFSYDDANTVVSIGGQTNGTKNTAISIGRDSNDISFYEDTGTTAKLFWDASAESLGIGTSSPASGLHLVNAGLSNQLRISNTTADSTTKYGGVLGSHYSNSEEPIAGMLLTSTSSVVGGAVSIGGGISDANAVNNIKFYTAANNTTTVGTERMRIDSSGNLLVGTTNTAVYTTSNQTGLVYRADFGLLGISRQNNYSGSFNRYGTDGDIVNFRKNGASVGSIGASGGDIYIGTGDSTILFSDSADAVVPRGTGGAARDGAINLGNSSNRFKDLYLSGDVRAGNRVYIQGSTTNFLAQGPYSSTNLAINFGNALFFYSGATQLVSFSTASAWFNKRTVVQGGTTQTAATPNIQSIAQGSGNGVTQYHVNFCNSGQTVHGRITSNNFSTTYATTSDYRVKEDVREMEGATERLLQLNPVNFKWKGSEIRTDGFLAHEVDAIVPEAVVGVKDATEEVTDDEGVTTTVDSLQALDQAKLVPLLIKTIQELEARITALENT